MWNVLRNRRDYRRLWVGGIVSHIGDWLAYIAVSVLALELGDGLLAVAMVFLAHTLPTAFLAPVAGNIADRFDRRQILVLTSCAQGLVTFAMVWAAATSALWTLQGMLVLRVSLAALFEPARSAAVPRLVARDEIETANVLSGATWSVVFALGVASGGLLSALFGPTLAIALDALTFFISAALLSGLPALPPERRERSASALGSPQLRTAWRRIRLDPGLTEAVLGKAPLAFAGGGAWVLLNQLSNEVALAGSAALMLGLIHGVRGIGTGVGPMLTLRIGRAHPRLVWAGAAWAAFLGVIGFALSSQPVWLLLFAALWGMGSGANWVLTSARRQLRIEDAFQGRAAAIDALSMTVAQSLSALFGALLAEWLREPRAAAWLGVGLGMTSWVALQLLVHGRVDWHSRASAAHKSIPLSAAG